MTNVIPVIDEMAPFVDDAWPAGEWAEQRAAVADEWMFFHLPCWWHRLAFWKPKRPDPIQMAQGFALIAIRAELRHLADVIEASKGDDPNG